MLLSDAAPKLTGVRATDRAREEALLEAIEAAIPRLLAPGGSLLVKLLDCPEAAGFVKRVEPLWSELLARGVTTAAAYPDFRTDERSFRRQARSVAGPERNILVVRLVDNSPAGN